MSSAALRFHVFLLAGASRRGGVSGFPSTSYQADLTCSTPWSSRWIQAQNTALPDFDYGVADAGTNGMDPATVAVETPDPELRCQARR